MENIVINTSLGVKYCSLRVINIALHVKYCGLHVINTSLIYFHNQGGW